MPPSVEDRRSSFGHCLRQWRDRRGLSQLDLAVISSVSQRHISFLESGRANPSRDMILELATVLDIPLREQNVMLTAAGFAPIYSESDLHDPQVEPVRKALDFILHKQEPYPAVVIDRYWNLLQSNSAATHFMNLLIEPQALQKFDRVNLMSLMFDPQGLRPFVANWQEVAGHLIRRVHREAVVEGQSEKSIALLNELLAYPDAPQSWRDLQWEWHTPLLTVNFVKGDRCFNFFSTIATLGTPYDITLQEVRVECLFPADEVTEENIRKLPNF
ncbi:helix-turn-helix domain-containing protein [Gloeocapsopsis dulcis]|uniref:Transcriptional regulator n=1 Tax=Gloeocapsopsis dulcis AAB1 = 1H9 TaxID=1433147 RepID=A0A6N8FTK6_9CHRO|nr:helix-turn-helix transcriptional regulator [Gloeocapsopsis dulcis]MUL36094.1 transcriptional regulator [Gloeocapsopsis dulcis AAB1 = 1H9]WNN91434.1 helix-turn-helix transcriptional regulator [Gloeocapsopsis dulcis]